MVFVLAGNVPNPQRHSDNQRYYTGVILTASGARDQTRLVGPATLLNGLSPDLRVIVAVAPFATAMTPHHRAKFDGPLAIDAEHNVVCHPRPDGAVLHPGAAGTLGPARIFSLVSMRGRPPKRPTPYTSGKSGTM
jgi:hypothetical protein